jgi:acyl carrier protein
MTDEEIYRQLTEIFCEVFHDDELRLTPDLTAADVPGWDSLRHVRLVLTAEKRFKRNFPASKISELKNVGEFVSLIRSSCSHKDNQVADRNHG